MEDPPSKSGQAERALWTAIVLKALLDISNEPLRSLEYIEAVAFFTSGGEWASSRLSIASQIDLHPDDLERAGRRRIARRREVERLPIVVTTDALISLPIVPIPVCALPDPKQPKPERDRNWWIAKFMAERT
jgi:hypothetical protein